MTSATGPPGRALDGLTLIASFMLGAGALAHLSAAAGHFAEWWAFGTLFLLAAGLQAAYAVALLLRPSRALLAAAAVLSAALVATWGVSRTIGLPFGPNAGTPEAVGWFDLLATLDEAVLIVLVGLGVARTPAARARLLLVACEGAGVAVGLVLTLAFAGGVGHG